ncbi:bHLH transcription factor [Prunus yedoensis var. nudiflora]|uniref:BHLH transcription factor n=1 Tax=Prunus yedoensis var. nudiflora TaxID=2094558 RepID=A0A314UXW8_PRUYE|nr:bHLH transcription factor [Prunus yedoensis var. nudiflora]
MRNLEGVAESLRPLVESKQWDYCVVWKLGDDPSRFIEMMGCCCGGGYEYDCVNVKEEEGEPHSAKLCRDGFLKHPIRTKACEALAQLPSSMPLYSGIHTEVIISAQPRWLSGHVNASGSNPSQSHDFVGTRVLIPVLSDLIELFSTKNVSASLNEFHVDPLPEECPEKLLPSLNLANFIPRPQVFPSSVSRTSSCPILEGSSSGSNPSSEHPLLSSRSRKSKRGDNLLQQQAGLACGSGSVVEKHKAKVTRKTGSGQYQSKNLFAERNRRSRIKDGHFALRALVPKISKMDIPAIIGDAVEYIEELKKKEKELQDELREIEEEEDLTKNKADVKILASDMRKEGSICLISTEHKQGSSSFVQKSPTAVQVELNQIGKRDCLIKLFYEQSRGGFARLMENMDSLGLQVVDANVTTFDGNVLNILKVQANRDIQAKKLRDKLIQLTRETNQTVHRGIN